MSHTFSGIFKGSKSFKRGSFSRFHVEVYSSKYSDQSLRLPVDFPTGQQPTEGQIFLLRGDADYDDCGTFRLLAPTSLPTKPSFTVFPQTCESATRLSPKFSFLGLCRNLMQTCPQSFHMELHLVGEYHGIIL